MRARPRNSSFCLYHQSLVGFKGCSFVPNACTKLLWCFNRFTVSLASSALSSSLSHFRAVLSYRRGLVVQHVCSGVLCGIPSDARRSRRFESRVVSSFLSRGSVVVSLVSRVLRVSSPSSASVFLLRYAKSIAVRVRISLGTFVIWYAFYVG